MKKRFRHPLIPNSFYDEQDARYRERFKHIHISELDLPPMEKALRHLEKTRNPWGFFKKDPAADYRKGLIQFDRMPLRQYYYLYRDFIKQWFFGKFFGKRRCCRSFFIYKRIHGPKITFRIQG
jgi:hypothetical protein